MSSFMSQSDRLSPLILLRTLWRQGSVKLLSESVQYEADLEPIEPEKAPAELVDLDTVEPKRLPVELGPVEPKTAAAVLFEPKLKEPGLGLAGLGLAVPKSG